MAIATIVCYASTDFFLAQGAKLRLEQDTSSAQVEV